MMIANVRPEGTLVGAPMNDQNPTVQGLPLGSARGKRIRHGVGCIHHRSKFVPQPDYVTGKPVKPRELTCYKARLLDDGYTCGPQGPYWEAVTSASKVLGRT
jgi:hypothetical protein